LLFKGLGGLSWRFVTSPLLDAGREGGIAPILVATGYILFVVLAVSLPVGLATAVWLNEYTRPGSRAGRAVRISLDALAGVPSIVFGLLGYAFFGIFLGFGYSILSGGLTLACMVLPIFIRTVEVGLGAGGNQWRRAGAALGVSRATIIWHVLLPIASPAIAAGLMLGIGRATAETAALLFTSGYVDRTPSSLTDSGRALAVHVYDLDMNVTGGDGAAFTSAVVRVLLVLAINGVALGFSRYWVKKRLGHKHRF
jgi:phosphate transport system permease protein